MRSPEQSPPLIQENAVESAQETNLAGQLEAQPRFQRICSVLSTVQSELQSEPDEAIRLEKWQRFNALFLERGVYSRDVKEMSDEEKEQLATVEAELLNLVKSSVYFGQFNSTNFAKQWSETDNGTLAKIFLSEIKENESHTNVENGEGKAFFIEYRTEGPYKIMELHINESNLENPLNYLVIIKNELQAIHKMLLQDITKVDLVQMESWLLSSSLDPILNRYLGTKLLSHRSLIQRDSTFPLSPHDDMNDYDDKLMSIYSMAVSYNDKIAQRWVKEGVLPEIGRIECTTDDFVEALNLDHEQAS